MSEWLLDIMRPTFGVLFFVTFAIVLWSTTMRRFIGFPFHVLGVVFVAIGCFFGGVGERINKETAAGHPLDR